MRKQLRVAVAVTAAVLALSAASLAAEPTPLLPAFFTGDTSSAERYVDRTARSASGGGYTLTVESSMTDGCAVYLIAKVQANTPEAREAMMAEKFSPMILIEALPVGAIEEAAKAAAEGGTVVLSGGLAVSYDGNAVGAASARMPEVERTADSVTLALMKNLPDGATSVRVRLDPPGEDPDEADYPTVEVSLKSAAPTVELTLNATGRGFGITSFPTGGSATLEQVRLTPFSLLMTAAYPELDSESNPAPLLRMADGSLVTPSQLGAPTVFSGSLPDAERFQGIWRYDFRQVLDLDQVAGVVVFGQEYPMDGGEPKLVAVDSRLLPFSLPLAQPGDHSDYSVPVRALCDGLGASCQWDNAAKTATIVYRGATVVLTLGSEIALVNGERMALPSAPASVNGSLVAPYSALAQALHIGIVLTWQEGPERIPASWLVTP